MGVEKKNKQERLQEGDELNSTFSLRSQGLEMDDPGILLLSFLCLRCLYNMP